MGAEPAQPCRSGTVRPAHEARSRHRARTDPRPPEADRARGATPHRKPRLAFGALLTGSDLATRPASLLHECDMRGRRFARPDAVHPRPDHLGDGPVTPPGTRQRKHGLTSLAARLADATTDATRGIAWMVVTGLLFVAVTAVIRHMGPTLPASEAAFLRYVIGFALLGGSIFRLATHLPERPVLMLFTVRGAAHAVGVSLWFYAMARIPIAEVTAIGYITPILVTLGAALVFREALRRRRVLGVVTGFLGALIILRPGFEAVSIGQLAQLGAATFFAVSYLATKRLTALASPEDIVVMLTLFVTLALLPMALWEWMWPTWFDMAHLAAAAVLATLGHWTMTKALQAAPISVTQPANFLQLVWASLIGIVFFAEAIDPWVIVGGTIIVTATTLIARAEVREARIATPPAGVTKWSR